MEIDLQQITSNEAYKLMTGSVIPRPIAWVSTVNAEGDHNLAPFSFFTVASRNPPMLLLSIGPGVGNREGTVKDTLFNIKDTKEFVINIVPYSLGSSMQRTSENVLSNVDEFVLADLTPIPSKKINVPRVKESPISFELRLDRIIELGTDSLIIGKIVNYFIDDRLYLGNYKVDQKKLDALGRLAGIYTRIDNFFTF